MSNQSNPIILLDSDEETEFIPASKQAIYIDLSDDEIPLPNTTPYDPLTAELEHILEAPLSTLLTPTRRNMLPKRDTLLRTGARPRNINLLTKAVPEPSRPIHRPERPLSTQPTPLGRLSSESSVSRATTSNYSIPSSLPRHRKKPVAESPFNRRPEPRKPQANNNAQKEKELEEVLENFVSSISSTRLKETYSDDERKARCRMCHGLYPISLITSHDQVCYGYSEVRLSRKKTIAEAVAIDENERKRRNIGKKDDLEPINYYAHSDEVFATDGSGFNESASSTIWEYAGQTHFG